MKKMFLNHFVLFCVIASLLSFDLPAGWIKAGSSPDKYDMGIDKGAGQDGKNVATIKSINKNIGNDFGTLMQECKPGQYLGKKVRLTGYVKSKNVDGWAGLWFRVDGEGEKRVLSFDNMQDRAIKGTTDWTKYEIILDVPANAVNLAYGALISGTGQIWLAKLSFEVVDPSVKSTSSYSDNNDKQSLKQDAPSNLDFEK